MSASTASREGAFSVLVTTNIGLVTGVAYSRTGDRALSQEIAQETFLLAWRKRPDAPSAWLCAVARKLAANATRRRRNERAALDRVAADGVRAASAPVTDGAGAGGTELEDALGDLPARYREPLVMYYWSDRSVREVARALRLTEATVRQRLVRGRQQLAHRMQDVTETALRAARPAASAVALILACLPSRAARAAGPVAPVAAWLAIAAGVAAVATVTIATVAMAQATDRGGGARVPVLTATPRPRPDDLAVVVAGNATGATPSTRGVSVAGGGVLARQSIAGAVPRAAVPHPSRRINLDVTGGHLRNVLPLLSRMHGIYIMTIDEERFPSSEVNLALVGVSFEEALDEVVRQAGARWTELPALQVTIGGTRDAGLLLGPEITARHASSRLADVVRPLGELLDMPIFLPDDVRDTPVTIAFAATPAGLALEGVLADAGLGVELTSYIRVEPDEPPTE